MASQVNKNFNTSGSVTAFYRPTYVVNVWVQIPQGESGTYESQIAENMRKEIARVFRTGFPTYGGSLTPFKLVLPLDDGKVRNDPNMIPVVVRYELTLVGVKQNE